MTTVQLERAVPIIAVLVVLAVGSVVLGRIIFGGAAGFPPARVTERDVISLINQRRARYHLAPLAADTRLHGVALAHSSSMLRAGYFAHDTPGGPTFDQRATRLHRRAVGENIAWGTGGFGTAKGIVSLWMASPEHRRIILTSVFRRIGVGITEGLYLGQGNARLATAEFSS